MSNSNTITITSSPRGPAHLYGNANMSSSTYNWNTGLGVTAQPITTLGNLTVDFGVSWKQNPDVKKYEVYESPEDILVLATTWKRMRDENRYGVVSKLMDSVLFKEITPADRNSATEIRDFYSKKIMMWNLKGNNITKYRQDLSKLIQSDGTMFKEDMLGLAYYLPAFYKYDSDIEEIRLTTECRKIPHIGTGTKTLEPIKKITKKSKRQHVNEYWFKEAHSNSPVVLSLQAKNPLEHIWDNMFDHSETLPIQANYIHKIRDDFEHYFIGDKWELKIG